MHYQTFEPSPELSPIVRCYWVLEGMKKAAPQKQTIVPDGCMEMIFHYGDLYRQYKQTGQSIVQPRCFVFGQLTRPLEIAPMGKTGIFSVRFHPDGFMPFATIPIRAMENSAVSLEKLFGKDGLELENKILNSDSISGRINHMESFLLNRLTETASVDRIVKSIVETLVTGNGHLTIEELSKQTKINRRQLERKFSSSIGLSPKQLSKTIRLQTALKMLLNKDYDSLTALAHKGEYYDQAHFIKEFKEFTGCTPKEFYGSHVKMSSLFFEQE